MRKISGVLLALAASLALGATTVAAKDYGDGVGVVAVRRCKTRARGAEAVKKCVVTKSTATWSTIIDCCDRSRHACADRWGWGGPRFRRCLWHHGC